MNKTRLIALSIMLAANAIIAQTNPCEPSYGWDPAPSLGDISAQPIDPIHVTEDLSYTPDWGDANDQDGTCVDSNGCGGGDETGSLSITYSWEIKKGGNLVDSGTGKTVTFSPSSTGLYTLYLTKEDTVSTANCGPTDLTETANVSFTVFELYDIQIKHHGNTTYHGDQESGSAGGDIWTAQSFDYRVRIQIGSNIVAAPGSEYSIRAFIIPPATSMTQIQSSSFVYTIQSTGSTTVGFSYDQDENGEQSGGEPVIDVSFTAMSLTSRSFSFNVHTNSGWSQSDIQGELDDGTDILQFRDREDDQRVALKMTVGSHSTFGTSGGQYNTIDNESEYNSLVSNISGEFLVVPDLDWCGESEPSGAEFLGCASVGGSTAVIASQHANDDTMPHEYGHMQGISGDYSSPDHRLMSSDGGDTVSSSERTTFR